MKLTLLELSAHPGEIAVTKIGSYSKGGVFFLDFSRPLATERWFLIWNFRFGYPLALHVPVAHESEIAGSRTIAVERSDPYFGELQRLWRTRHPTSRKPPTAHLVGAAVAEDFNLHFPKEGTSRERTAA